MRIFIYVFNDQMVQGYRGVHINTRHNEESLGEMYRKDDIDVSNQDRLNRHTKKYETQYLLKLKYLPSTSTIVNTVFQGQ